MLSLTIVTNQNPRTPGYFGKGRYGGIVDFAVQEIADYLTETEPYKYARLPLPHNGVSSKKIFRKKPFYGNDTDTELQTNKYRRSSKSRSSYKYQSLICPRCRQLCRTNRKQQRSSYRSKGYVYNRNDNIY